ncbi:hypothetical protein TICRE_16280 [Tissierella creatinophila DSM 6911]|uniref:Uncharacterized protein n=2 Tax=Tissierella creatinophila TaxID=79681 RepID=A0A1U7M500_TISCR|nr:hypothetical protein TICRE_16280 [Tissierella creatinophila DSM 6911]
MIIMIKNDMGCLKMRKLTVLIFLLIGLILIVGCNKETSEFEKTDSSETKKETKLYEEKIKELEEQNNEYKILNSQLEEESDSYKNFAKETIKHLDDDEILELAKNEFRYKIEIDGKPIIDNKDIEFNNSNFKISIIEEQSIVSSTIDPWFEKGSLDGEYQDHLEIIGIEPININSTDGTIVTGFIYEFKDIPENINFKLKLSNQLKERIGLKNSIINIHVK